MDCYFEEESEDFNYTTATLRHHAASVRASVSRGAPPLGMRRAQELVADLGLAPRVEFSIGLSPDDVPGALGDRKIDAALVDGGHFGDQPSQDFESIQNCLDDRCAVFFHDNNDNPAVAAAVRAAENKLGVRAHIFPTRYNLTLVGRGLDDSWRLACERSLLRNMTPLQRRWTVALTRWGIWLPTQ
jgi:hypothetical protein